METTPSGDTPPLPKILPEVTPLPTVVYQLVLGSGIWVSASFQIIPHPVGRLGLRLWSRPHVVGRL